MTVLPLAPPPTTLTLALTPHSHSHSTRSESHHFFLCMNAQKSFCAPLPSHTAFLPSTNNCLTSLSLHCLHLLLLLLVLSGKCLPSPVNHHLSPPSGLVGLVCAPLPSIHLLLRISFEIIC
ncbi:hypothetical protein BASA62_009855 [Batrachochytrium salamandrivorans]|nr:hypothetical protein BASA62_009855 [Batrachochytrium salamandrivorans]